MTIQQLNERYRNIPQELKTLKRWVGYKVETLFGGKKTKRPYNALTGSMAKVNDSLTWSTFNLAISGCTKYGFDGIGFVLGDGIFGVDLDNHFNENGELETPQDEFNALASEFIDTLDSYTEWSQSGHGIHIICKGKLPEGSRRKGCVEMYDANRFFVFTGNAIKNVEIKDGEEKIVPLWEKYVYTPVAIQPISTHQQRYMGATYETLKLSDEEVLTNVANSRQAQTFFRYYDNGDTSLQGGDASKADMAFCSMLAFWCNKDAVQMDRIFRNSGLMRPKWDEFRGQRTYGQITIDVACRSVGETFVKTKLVDKVTIVNKDKKPTLAEEEIAPTSEEEVLMNLDENGEPIFRYKKIYGHYPLSDTGNAMRFYDYFGELFKYNVTDKTFMFWTGKAWIKDTTGIVRKYANKLIEIMKEDDAALANQIVELSKSGETEKAKQMETLLNASQKNTARVANKAGKDAMLFELQSIKDIAVQSSEFDKDDYLLNTDSGIVNLRTGEILPFDKSKMMSKNTNTKVSYERSEVWEKFLYSVFDNGNEAETLELIESLQTCLGYSLTGSTCEQVMFLLYGEGSNGKSTLTETIANIMGTYADNISSSVLVQQKNQSGSAIYSIAKLQNARFVETGETDDGGRLNEAQTKILTGGDTISAQFKFGHEFSYKPKFKIWMSTNNLPNIRGGDYGIWRRIFLFTFRNTFSDKQKDKTLPDKLRRDADKILGWCIKGYQKYQERNGLIMPKQIKDDIQDFKKRSDILAQFIDKKCVLDERGTIECTEMYKIYKDWAADNTEFVKKESQFSVELTMKPGITMKKNNAGILCYYGIRPNGVVIRKQYD